MKKLLAATLVGTILVGLGGVWSPADAQGQGKTQKTNPEAAFRKRDANGDGVLTLAEFQGKKGNAKAQARFQRLDRDNDGKVTLAEFTARTPKKKAK